MSQVSVTVNGKTYVLACGEGEEPHLARLAQAVDRRITQLVASVGQVGEARLLLMAALMATDELWDATKHRHDGDTHAGPDAGGEALSGEIDALAERIEAIAVRLEAT
jgi:cell division protein ZapA